jgi:hypothetical protein
VTLVTAPSQHNAYTAGYNTRNIAMSLSEIERFAADLKSNAALRAEAEKAQADKSDATPLHRPRAVGGEYRALSY